MRVSTSAIAKSGKRTRGLAATAFLLTAFIVGEQASGNVVVSFDDHSENPDIAIVTVSGWNDTIPGGNRTDHITLLLAGFMPATPNGAQTGSGSFVLQEPATPDARGPYSDLITFSWNTSTTDFTALKIELTSVDFSSLPLDQYGSPVVEVWPFNVIPLPPGLPPTQSGLEVDVASADAPEPASIVTAVSGLVFGLCVYVRRRRFRQEPFC